MKILSKESFARAREFVKGQARDLDRRMFEHIFERGSQQPVLQALQRYQNDDGGFGNAIEPDFRLPFSSPMASTMGLDVLHRLGLPTSHPMVEKAIRYLLASYDPAKGYWPSVPPEVNQFPHAPWWHFDAQLQKGPVESPANPGADIIGYLHTWSDLVPADFLERVTASILAWLDSQPDAMEMHDLICLVRMAAALPEPLRLAKNGKLKRAIEIVVARDPQAWASYGPQPLMYVASPNSPFAPVLGQAVEANLDYLIDTQGVDGSWSPNWSWGENYPAAWEEAKRDLQGYLTVENLRMLHAFSRISPDV